MRTRILTSLLVLFVIGIAALGPVIFVVLRSFDVAGPGEAFRWGLEGWREAFGAQRTLNALKFTLLLSLRVFVGLALAFLISWLLIRVKLPARGFIEFSFWLAWFLPPLPVTLGWVLLLDPQYGLINQGLMRLFSLEQSVFNIYSFFGILWIHLTLVTVPVMTILLTPAFRQLDASFEEGSRVCGAGARTTLVRIVVPLLLPTLLVVLIASLIRSLEAFEVEQVIGIPAKIYVYGTRIYDLVNWEPPRFSQAMALSTLFLGVLLLLIFAQQSMRATQYATLTGRGMSFRAVSIGGWRYVATAFCLFFVLAGVYLPLLMVLVGSTMRLFGFFTVQSPFTAGHWLDMLREPNFLNSVRNSVVMGVSVTLFGVAVYSLVGYFLLRVKNRASALAGYLVWLPWAIPGILIGLALLWLFLSLPLVSRIHGTLWGLVLALVIKEMPIGVHLMKASFGQIDEDLEKASRVCGAKWLTTFRRVTLPLAMPMMASIAILIFTSAIRDISTTILLSTPSTRPLSVYMMELAATGDMARASVVGVCLSLLAVALALVARRIGWRLGADAY